MSHKVTEKETDITMVDAKISDFTVSPPVILRGMEVDNEKAASFNVDQLHAVKKAINRVQKESGKKFSYRTVGKKILAWRKE